MNIGPVLNHNRLNKLFLFLLFIIAAFPLLPQKITPIVIALWIISGFFSLNKNFYKINPGSLIILLAVFILPFILYWFSLLYDSEKKVIYFILERKMSLLFFPIVFFIKPYQLNFRDFKTLVNTFVFATLIEACWVNAAVFLFSAQPVQLMPGDFIFNYRQQFEFYSGIHPTYMSMMVFFSFLLNLDQVLKLNQQTEKWNLIIRICAGLLLLLTGALLGARTPLLAGVFSVGLLLMMKFRLNKRILLFAVIGLLTLFSAVLITPGFKTRMMEFKGLQWRPPVFNEENTANIRIGIYYCSLELLKENWLAGVGPGQLQDALNYCYTAYPPKSFANKNYNTHNEYLNSWLSLGIIGFISFILTLICPLIFSIKHKDYLYTCFLVFFFCCCLTENLLSRQMGIVFYAFFNSLFAFRKMPETA